jgi:glutamate/tyrosine decarboxylase-like PLP-dependent enzyme
MTLPTRGLDRTELLDRLAGYRRDDVAAHGGRTFAYVYDGAIPDVEQAAREAYLSFLDVNGLDPTAFPSLRRMENDVVAAVAERLGGDGRTAGTFTSGGTESILCAVKVARDLARERGGPAEPEVVLPVTGHASFAKACHYLGLRVVPVPVDPATFRADPAEIKAAITERTALLVASAPSYAHGVIDPVADIAALGAERGIPVHVDACIGGWLLSYARRLGRSVPDFDLSVPGVTSLSVDLHKYGYTPKGASVVLYRDAALRAHQYFAYAGWAGYTMINATVQSTKSGGPLAGAWATMHALGDEGYATLACQALDATDTIVAGVQAISQLRVLGSPDMSLVAIASDEVDVFALADRMNAAGWYVQPQLSLDGLPRNLHLTVTAATEPVAGEFVETLRSAVAELRDRPPSPPDPQLLAVVDQLDPATLSPDTVAGLASAAGLDLDAAGGGMATVNALLEAMPAATRERLLVAFLSLLYTPSTG